MPQFNSAKYPRSNCAVCGKEIVVMASRGKGSVGFCGRICAGLYKFKKRYTGSRADRYERPNDIMEKARM